MQAEKQNRDSTCETLASPRKLYDILLLSIHRKFNKEEKDLFEFSFRHDMPMPVLETQNPLKWFRSLEQQLRLSWKDVNSLVDFLEEASLDDLLTEARYFQARIRVIEFLQRHLQANLPELCLDDKFNEKWCLKQNLPKHYLKRCQRLLHGTQTDCDVSINRVRSLFSKGVVLLVNSCSPLPSCEILQSACLKLLYLADLFYNRFKEIIVNDEELLNIKPSLPYGKFQALDNRRRRRRKRHMSSVPAEVQQQVSNKRSSREVLHFHVKLCLSFLLGLFTSILGMIRGREEVNRDGLEGDLSD